MLLLSMTISRGREEASIEELMMAVSVGFHPAAFANLLDAPAIPISNPFQCRNFRLNASTSTEFIRNFSKREKIRQLSDECFTGGWSAHNGVLREVINLLRSLDCCNSEECSETCALILRKCRKLDDLELGRQVHAHIIVSGVELCEFLGSQLLELHCKIGHVQSARKMFDIMPSRNVFNWTAMMAMYYRLGHFQEIINLFYLMIDEGVRPDHFVFPKVFKACSELRDLQVGKKIYNYMLSIGFEGNALVKSSLLDMFIKCGRLDIAKQLFEEMKSKDIFVWNVMVSGYASNGELKRAMKCIGEMKLLGIMPDRVTWNSIITGYAQNGQLEEAVGFFNELSNFEDFRPNVVSWTALIAGFEQNDYFSEALCVFKKMLLHGVKPNSITIASVISACTSLSLLRKGKEIHGYCIRSYWLDSELLVRNTLINLYAKCHSLELARKKLNTIQQKDIITWNAMIAAYALKGRLDEAIELLNEMELNGVEPDIVTWNGLITGCTKNGDSESAFDFFFQMCRAGMEPNITSISGALSACSKAENLNLGKEIHGYVIRHLIEMSTGIGSALISMYSACNSLQFAQSVFNNLNSKDEIIWNSMISACIQSRDSVSALNQFRDMIDTNVKPDSVTIVSVLPACSRLAALRKGREIHQLVIRYGLYISNFVCNALIDMYGRCGSVERSKRVFDMMTHRDIVSYNVMISVYGMHGFGIDAINLFERLRLLGLEPNHCTFTNLLSACSHSGLINEGCEYFEMMKTDYAMEPAMEQYACMVDIMSRSGQFDKTLEFIKNMPIEPNAAVWGALLGACRIHSNLDVAEYAAGYLFELDPQNSGNYILLANIYSSAGRWEEAAAVRCLMWEQGVTKSPGCSWIEVKKKVHSFIVGDSSHPLAREIRAKIDSLYVEIKKIGYVPQTKCVLQKNVEEDEKELSLCGHSEKMALAFGLISTPKGTPLRIIKNLRVCEDCHSATRYISKLENREVIMRDNYRFHHFVDGVCSCGDYW